MTENNDRPTQIKKAWTKLQGALSIYQKFENNQLQLKDLERPDMHFKMQTGADILIEENGIHIPNPFSKSIQSLEEWSRKESVNFDIILQNYLKWHKDVKDNYDHETLPTYKPYFESDGFEAMSGMVDPDEILKYCRARIQYLRENDGSFEAWTEIEHRRQNVFDILYWQSNKNIEDPLIKLYGDKLSLTNTVTILQNMYESEYSEKLKGPNYKHKQRQYTIGEAIELLKDPKLNAVEKGDRPLLLPNTTGNRINGDEVYMEWSGLQIFDLDLKFSPSFNEHYETAEEVRDILFQKLKHYPWLLGIVLSSSGRALHVYTKVSRMHHLFSDDEGNIEVGRYWYRMSYIQKHAAIAYCLDKFTKVKIYEEDTLTTKEKIIDSHQAKPSQGIAMNYDPQGRWNTNFIDLYPIIFYHVPPEDGIEAKDWLLRPEILDKYKSWFYNNAQLDETNVDIQSHQGELKLIVDSTVQLNGVKQIDMDSLGKGEKYNTRWRICNALAYAYGDTDIARTLANHILQSDKSNTKNSINSFIRSAIMNKKEADVYSISQLKKLGLKIAIEEESKEEISDDIVSQTKFMLDNSDYGFKQVQPDINFKLNDDQYLGMRMKAMISSLKEFKVNVIESAPNTGKTEFFKTLSKSATVCLVIPFTSTIESKIVPDESINKLFDVYYGDKSVKDIKKGRSVVMTFDKFSQLPKSKYSMFKFIAIDESHLLFTSTYRLPVISQTIENIRTYLQEDIAEVKDSLSSIMSIQSLMKFVKEPEYHKQTTKFIMMTGTLTGEVDYFKFYGLLNYIKVHKLHPHGKSADIILSKDSETRDIRLFDEIVRTLQAGGKVIHPTNKGDAYAKKVIACVEDMLCREVKYEYYKRANNDEEFLQNINQATTVKDIEILFCSDYLSVGIDIKDVDNFSVIFSNDFTAESIEQFNNRLRSTDISCKIFYDVIDSDGMQKNNIINTNIIRYQYNDELRNIIEDEESIAKLQKSIQSKSQYFAVLGELFSKYFIQDYAGKIKYIRSAFEIEQFELQYSVIARSLLYIKTALHRKYNYDIRSIIVEDVDQNRKDHFGELMSEAKREHDLLKSISFTQLVDFLASDVVYEAMTKNEYVFDKDFEDIPDREAGLHLGYDENRLNGTFIITWNKKHKLVLDEAKKFVKKMRKLYSHQTVNRIVESCTKPGGLINKTDIARYERLMNLLFDDRKHTLSLSTKQILETAYEYVDPNLGQITLDRFEYEELRSDIQHIITTDFVDLTETTIKSRRRQENIQQLVTKFVDTLFIKRVAIETVSIQFRKVYKFDSKFIQETIERDRIYSKILLNEEYDDTKIHSTNTLAQEHYNPDITLVS